VNKPKRILGVWLTISGVFGILSFTISGVAIGILLAIAGVMLIKKHPKELDPTQDPTSRYAPREHDLHAMDDFLSPLANVPRYKLTAAGEYKKPLLVKDLVAMPHTNISKSTSSDKYFRFIAIDIETTGLNATEDIIEVSAIKWVGGEPVEIFTSLCKSDNPIPADATKINHITDDMIASAPYFYNILPDLQAFISDFPLVGHNIDFDLKFLQRYGLDVTTESRFFFDTLDLARKSIKKDNGKDYKDYYDRVENYKLGTICRFFHIKVPVFHRSLCDAYATSLIFFKLIARITG